MRSVTAAVSVSMMCLAAGLFTAAAPKSLHAQATPGGGAKATDSCSENLKKAIVGLKLCRSELASCEARSCPMPEDPGGGLTHMGAMKALLEHPDDLSVEEATKLSLLSAKVLDSKARVLPKDKLTKLGKALAQTREALKKVDATVVERKAEATQ